MKRTCDMEVNETYQDKKADGSIKTMKITSKEFDANGFLIVQSVEVIV